MLQEGFPRAGSGVSAKRAAGLRVACRSAIAVALAIGIPEGVSQPRELRGIAHKSLCNGHLRYQRAMSTRKTTAL